MVIALPGIGAASPAVVRHPAISMLVVGVPVVPVPVVLVPALVRASRVSMRVRVALVRVVAVPGRRGRWWCRCVRRRGSWW
ncbi:hypothetical protein GCM10010116_57880 [Microbispora rosea subsp. aerata]|nr:hypothetical protein GCM10010116_57880 [Microbispora rosea subsp. aerata]